MRKPLVLGLVIGVLSGCQPSGREVVVTREQFGDDWPLQVNSAKVLCASEGDAAYLRLGRKLYALNAAAEARGVPSAKQMVRQIPVDPRNPRILLQVAYALRQVKRYDDALSTLDRALLYGAHDDDVRDTRGRILLYELNRPADAILDLERATQLDPGSKKYWYNYGLALYRTKDCKAVEALSTYRKVCEAGARCTKTSMAWAAEVIEYLKNPRICP